MIRISIIVATFAALGVSRIVMSWLQQPASRPDARIKDLLDRRS